MRILLAVRVSGVCTESFIRFDLECSRVSWHITGLLNVYPAGVTMDLFVWTSEYSSYSSVCQFCAVSSTSLAAVPVSIAILFFFVKGTLRVKVGWIVWKWISGGRAPQDQPSQLSSMGGKPNPTNVCTWYSRSPRLIGRSALTQIPHPAWVWVLALLCLDVAPSVFFFCLNSLNTS
jgi:hypothetical protein